MSRTVTAYYDTRAAADAARARLAAAGFDTGANVFDRSSEGYSETEYSTRDKPGIWASIKNAFLPDEDRHTYEEGIRRGGAVVSVDVDGDDVPRAVAILEDDASDLDARSQSWRDSGWNYGAAAAAGSAAAATGVDMGTPHDRSPDYDRNGPAEYGFATRETSTGRTRSYFGGDYASEPGYAHGGRAGTLLANKAGGLVQEGIGNVKQSVGELTGNERLRQDGVRQEDHGERLQGSRD